MTKVKTTHPKYQQLGEQLISKILNLDYQKGQLLPTEKELCESYAISCHTAREALRYLEKAGLVERHPDYEVPSEYLELLTPEQQNALTKLLKRKDATH